ncbi:hypothetical protein VKT23_007367 [Stygiomarasmius scandens]|uniref:Uncharacterized protein n=1 Tax=Marasmiellus scandens TaxID=2682957 RepID=A0ABR1JNZ4_9AGAR
MAFQTSSSAAPSSSNASSSNSSSNSGISSARGANYFFGFLVTFIALLLLFIGCGVGSRRRLNRRRALFGDLTWDSRSVLEEPPPEPQLLEPCLRKGGDIWSLMQPLSTALVPSSSSSNKPAAPPPMIRSPSRNPAAIHGLSLPTWRPSLVVPTADKQKEKDKSDEDDAQRRESEIQIAVMIAMPSRSRTSRADDEQELDEYQIGVARIPWDKGLPA